MGCLVASLSSMTTILDYGLPVLIVTAFLCYASKRVACYTSGVSSNRYSFSRRQLLALGLLASCVPMTQVNHQLTRDWLSSKLKSDSPVKPRIVGPSPQLNMVPPPYSLRGKGFSKLVTGNLNSLSRCKAHSMLGSISIDDVKIDLAIPDTGSNYNVFPGESYLATVLNRINLDVEGVAGAKATHVGSARLPN